MAKRTQKTAAPEIRTLAVSALQAAAYNPRTISDAAMAGLSASLARFGCVEPVVVNVRGGKKTIVGGHQRVKALTAAGVKEAACVVVSLSEADEKALNVTLNNPLICGEFSDALGDLIAGLETSLPESDLLDLRIAELKGEIDGEMGTAGLTDPDDVPEPPKKATTKPGDLWLLGEHRLLCGDSTKAEDVERLMDGQKADMCFTDPPYGVNVKGGGKSNKTIAGDLTQVAIPFSFDLAVQLATKEDARFYFCGGEGNLSLYDKLFDRFLNQLPRHLIWVKNGFVMKPNNYHNQYEIIYFGYKPKGGGLDHWFGERTEDAASDVWRINRDNGADYLHPTQKPVALPIRAITNSCCIEAVVYEPFLGSGSTLIACEKMNRRCYGMELDPIYCDVIVQRWQAFTGQTATLSK
jgi:DNA modification methylase